jgi:type II secretory pathway pseudopilin PulG
MKKAFTITELMVAVGLMAAVMAGTGYVFKVAVEAQRTANATSEIMRNLRGITDQLDRDFRGILKDAPLAISFWTNPPANNLRADRIRFWASGDFQSLRQYPVGTNGKTVSGNVACISYGQSLSPDPFAASNDGRAAKILTRRQTIFTSDTTLPDPCMVPITEEYQRQSLAEWKVNHGAIDVNTWTLPPTIDPNDLAENEIPVYMARGVDDFAIQISSGIDPNGSGSLVWWPDNTEVAAAVPFSGYPLALKFTFTLYAHAKNGKAFLLPNGNPLKMTFTHIVYLK